MKQIYITLTILLLTAQAMLAQLTLNDCLLYAREHAHGNVINRLEKDKANLNKRMAVSAVLPSLEFSTSGNMSFGRNSDPETNTYDNKQTVATSFGLYVSLPLFDGLAGINRIKAAHMARLQQQYTAQAEEDRISLEVINAFYNVAYCKAMVGQMEQQLERDRRNLEATRRDESTGFKSGADVAEMDAVVAADLYELTNQRGLLSKAYMQLRGCMGMELSDTPLQLVETDTCATFTADDDTFAGIPYGEHPRIAAARMAVNESTYALRAAKGAFAPQIALNAGISTSYYKMVGSGVDMPSFSRQWHDNMGQYVGVSLSIPIFTGLANTNRVKLARVELMQQRTRLDQTRYEIERETAEAALDWEAANDEWLAARTRLEAEQIAYNAMERKFQLGNASAIDLYTSGTKLATARANLEGKRIRRIISRITLEYYRGEPLIKE